MKLKTYLCAAMAAMLALGAVSCNKGTKAAVTDEQANVEAQQDVMMTEAAISEAFAGADGVAMLVDDNLFRPDSKVPALVVLDFNATWCIPCKKLTPAFDQVSKEMSGKAWFFSVDIDNMRETAQAFGIKSVPTVVLLRPNAQPEAYVGLDRFLVGAQNVQDLTEKQLTEVITGNMKEVVEGALK